MYGSCDLSTLDRYDLETTAEFELKNMTVNQDMIQKLKTLDARYNEIVDALSESGVTGDPEKLKNLGKALNDLDGPSRLYRKYKELEKELAGNTALLDSETDSDMKYLYKDEIDRIKTDIDEMESAIEKFFNPTDDEEDKQFIIEIRAGTGGNEAGLFAGDLFRMYLKYAEIKGWKFESISESPTPLGGFKEVMFSMRGPGALARLRYESGVHRVQRIPVTESSGRIHTSAATVAVLIEPDEIEVVINPSDLKIDTFRSTGAGGQSVNKIESAIRITHIPTGVVVECQDERSQHQNRAKAMRILRARIVQQLEEEQNEKIASERRSQVGSGDRSERIRTYNFPQNRVTDHRANVTVYQLDSIMEGMMDTLLEQLVRHMREMSMSSE